MMSCFFESQPYGELLFSIISKTELTHWSGFFYSSFKGLFPFIVTLLFVKFLCRSKASFVQRKDSEQHYFDFFKEAMLENGYTEVLE